MQALKTYVKKLGVIGSRRFTNKKRVYTELDEIHKLCPNLQVVVSGGAGGPDTYGVNWAQYRKLRIVTHLAKWDDMAEPCLRKKNEYGKEYNALAGFKRNQRIIDDSDLIVAFWDGYSPGTRDSIDKARKANKELIIIRI